MSAAQALDAAKKRITQQINDRVAAVSDHALPFVEYQHICGLIRGLRLANEEISSLLQTLKEQDDD